MSGREPCTTHNLEIEMALQKLQFRPGVNRESTTYANEGGFYACDKIRFRSGFAEKIGIAIEVTPGDTCRVALKK